MSTTLDEKILEAIKTAYDLALASASTEEQKKGVDNFYHVHLNPLQFQIPTWTEQAIEAYIAERVETAEAKSFKNGFDEGVALHDQDVKAERERISHELKEIAWDDSKVRPGLKQVNLEFALEIVNKSLKSNERS